MSEWYDFMLTVQNSSHVDAVDFPLACSLPGKTPANLQQGKCNLDVGCPVMHKTLWG